MLQTQKENTRHEAVRSTEEKKWFIANCADLTTYSCRITFDKTKDLHRIKDERLMRFTIDEVKKRTMKRLYGNFKVRQLTEIYIQISNTITIIVIV